MWRFAEGSAAKVEGPMARAFTYLKVWKVPVSGTRPQQQPQQRQPTPTPLIRDQGGWEVPDNLAPKRKRNANGERQVEEKPPKEAIVGGAGGGYGMAASGGGSGCNDHGNGDSNDRRGRSRGSGSGGGGGGVVLPAFLRRQWWKWCTLIGLTTPKRLMGSIGSGCGSGCGSEHIKFTESRQWLQELSVRLINASGTPPTTRTRGF